MNYEMSIIIKVRSKKINVLNLNEDCNYELNQYEISKALSYIKWPSNELKILNKSSLIDWSIYSTYDLTLENFIQFGDQIDFDMYLSSIEIQYKTINYKIIEKINTLSNITNILKKHILKNKSFYFECTDFLKQFKALFDLYNLDDVLKYINTSDLLLEYVEILPLSFFDRILNKFYLHKISLGENLCKLIIQRFATHKLDQENITKIIFSTQLLSFNFIVSCQWSYEVWISIFKSQDFTEDQLLQLLRTTSIKIIISKYARLSEFFIRNYSKHLDMNSVIEHQELSYEFVKEHYKSIDFALLSKNKKVKFTILNTNTNSELDNIHYIISKETHISSIPGIIFID